MEMEPSPPVVAKKLWNIVRIVFFMVRNGLSKSKIMMDLHLMLKRGKLAGKAIAENFLFNYSLNSSLSCRSNDAVSFVSPREYEFSCSNSPTVKPFHFINKRKHHHHHHHSHFNRKSYRYDDVATVTAVQKVLEMCLNNNEMAVEASPLVSLPGFGKSPLVRQLRITDSPFPLKDEGGDNGQVDVEAEEFIKRFYKDLKSQTRMNSLQSPAYDMRGRR
ncbi:hypothetical protein FNV43_RR16904 [Rhamnella rubrinervis]|uniref:Avr9/Cf-9 rapidly elicited protein n=1 Tax=Rhamnella rubrinervis TaxID=2594499 RepID=A0A8K0ME09_9ROSA|nr:hypothetical protein FNV43_RR16904 [Rhamnella rubrinervis]